MAAKVTTAYGSIMIDEEVLAKVAGMAALECYGVVGMAQTNMKDGFVQLLTGDSLTKGIKVEAKEESVIMSFHIIVEYGTNIQTIADNLISNVTYQVKDMLGVNIEKINVFVEGIRTDKQGDA